MKFCPRCGFHCDDHDVFCTACGNVFNNVPPQAPMNNNMGYNIPNQPPMNNNMGYNVPNQPPINNMGYNQPINNFNNVGYDAPAVSDNPHHKALTFMEKFNDKRLTTFNFIFDLLAIVYLIFKIFFTSYASAYRYASIYYYGIRTIGLVTCIFLGLLASGMLAFGIISFIYGMKQKDDLRKKLYSTLRFITGILVFMFTVLFLFGLI